MKRTSNLSKRIKHTCSGVEHVRKVAREQARTIGLAIRLSCGKEAKVSESGHFGPIRDR
jgi:hypothetical protein